MSAHLRLECLPAQSVGLALACDLRLHLAHHRLQLVDVRRQLRLRCHHLGVGGRLEVGGLRALESGAALGDRGDEPGEVRDADPLQALRSNTPQLSIAKNRVSVSASVRAYQRDVHDERCRG